MKRAPIAVAGAGHIGRNHIAAIRCNRGARVAAIVHAATQKPLIDTIDATRPVAIVDAIEPTAASGGRETLAEWATR